MTTAVQIQKKKRSLQLEKLLEALAPDFDKLQSKVNAVFEQGRKEGFDDMEIGKWVRSKMKDHYTDRTIRNVLPDSAKYAEKIRKRQNFAEISSANERELLHIPANKVIVTQPKEEQPVDVAKVTANVLILGTSIPQMPQPHIQEQPNHPLREQPGPKGVQGHHNIAPEDYKVEDLDLYDQETLIEIVKYLRTELTETATSVSSIERHLSEENESLKKQLEEAKPFLDLLSLVTPETKQRRLERLKEELAVLKERGLEL